MHLPSLANLHKLLPLRYLPVHLIVMQQIYIFGIIQNPSWIGQSINYKRRAETHMITAPLQPCPDVGSFTDRL
jgi:hypothetical protein